MQMYKIHNEIELAKKLMPPFPRTYHLGIEPNATDDDKVLSLEETMKFLEGNVVISEKVDGSNLAIRIINGKPFVRNRNHVLRKGYTTRNTPAQQQYARVWSWLYEKTMDSKFFNYEKIMVACDMCGDDITIYGEWVYAQHTIGYDALPDLFIGFDIWSDSRNLFLDPDTTRHILTESGFATPAVREWGKNLTVDRLKELRDMPSELSASGVQSEGIYLTQGNGQRTVERFKMVGPHFKSDDTWNKKQLVKNQLAK